jgi:hypothetical protein
MPLTLRQRERITVRRDGEEVDVFNWVTVQQASRVRGHNPVVETVDTQIGAGDSMMEPDAVTPWVAEELQDEFYIDVEERGIEVIDPEADDVEVL